MDNRELERLMDRYRRELIEFSRMNSGKNSVGEEPDEREKRQMDAESGGTSYERDRSDPLPAPTPEPEPQPEPEPEPEAEAEPAQVQITPARNLASMSGSNTPDTMNNQSASADIPRLLRQSCEIIANDPTATQEQRRRCREINEFLTANNETGTMRVEATAADRAFGICSARVMIFLPLPSGNVTVFDGLTNVNGSSLSVTLPAPPKSISQQEDNGGKAPFAVYSVYVEHPSFVRAIFTNVPVFSGTESIQPVAMLAKAAGAQEPDPIVVDQSERNSL